MIYFVLPDYYHNFIMNKFLQAATFNDLDKLKQPVQFYAASGTFPFSIWNGQYNCIDGALYEGKLFPIYRDYDCYKDISVPVRLNCSNICLDPTMFDDEHMNEILKLNECLTNYIEVSNLKLLEYIHENYPKFKFIFSDNADFINNFTVDMINTLTEFDELSKVKIPFRLARDLEFLKQIKDKNKIEIVVNSLCSPNCSSYKSCHIANDEAQTNYSNQNPFLGCFKNQQYTWNVNNSITLNEIQEVYIPLGYKYFSFTPIPNISLFNKVLYYFAYFFKEEEVLKMIKLFNDQEGFFK